MKQSCTNHLDNLLSRLERVKRVGGDSSRYSAQCPAHDDLHNSLSIREGNDGRLLLHCHAGCATPLVVERLGLEMHNLAQGARDQGNRKVEATYDYRDAGGNLMFQVVRFNPKSFLQRRPDGRGGWVWNLEGVQPTLYRLQELLDADPGIRVYLCEGEKDTDRLRELGLVATTSPAGAGKWRVEYADYLRGRNVVILPDNDPPGKRHALRTARSLMSVAASVRIVQLPNLDEHGDVSDWLDAGGSREALENKAADTPALTPDSLVALASAVGEENREQGKGALPDALNALQNAVHSEAAPIAGSGRVSQATLLVDMALRQGCTLFHTPGEEGYASVTANGHAETWPLKSRGFRRWMARLFYEQTNKTPGGQAMQDALSVLEGQAIFGGEARPVYVRIAHHAGDIYLDLANEQWQSVKITRGGWDVVDHAPVAFRRSRGMLPLPSPDI